MKKVILLVVCLVASVSLSAQSKKYLFDSFKEGFVYYKDGRQFKVPLNYNLLTRQYIFIDQKDENREKEFSEPGMIVSIEIEKRTFLPPSQGATEVIQADPAFYVEYQGVSKKAAASVGYGGTSDTSSAASYSGMRGNFIVGGIEQDNKTLTNIDKAYKVKVGKKMKTFFDQKKFIKLFPAQKEAVELYIQEHPVDFNIPGQVLQLYNYACSLQ